MIDQILSKLGLSESAIGLQSRRKYPRHPGVQAEVSVGGRVYSVHDWSMGGVFFETAPDSRIVVGDQVQLDIKFRLPHEVVTISQPVRVVRSVRRGIAAAFEQITPETRKRFEKVIDSFHAQSFLESQVA